MTVSFQKYECFVENLAEKKHNLGADQLAVALTLGAPLSTYTQLSDLTEISYVNCSTRNITTSSSSQAGGTYSLVLADLTLTAGGGPVGPFRYVTLYNTVPAGFELIGFYDYSSEVTMAGTDTFVIDFNPAGAVQIV